MHIVEVCVWVWIDVAQATFTSDEYKQNTQCNLTRLNKTKQTNFAEFNPILKAERIRLPKDCAIVVANSLVASEKAVDAAKYFNKRVVECNLAIFVLARLGFFSVYVF